MENCVTSMIDCLILFPTSYILMDPELTTFKAMSEDLLFSPEIKSVSKSLQIFYSTKAP